MNNAIKVVNEDEPEYVIKINKNLRGEYDSVSIQNHAFYISRKDMNTILANTTTWAVKFKTEYHAKTT